MGLEGMKGVWGEGRGGEGGCIALSVGDGGYDHELAEAVLAEPC